MKVPSAALALVLAASSASAFSTATSGWGVSSRRSAFVDSAARRKIPSQIGPRNRNGALIGRRRMASVEEDIVVVSGDSAATIASDIFFNDGFIPMNQAEAALSRKVARRSAAKYLEKFVGQTAASVIYQKLQENGVTVVNGYSGGAILPLLDQFHVNHPRHSADGAPAPIQWITNSNESSAGHIAEGFAKSADLGPDGKMQAGVVVATSGPGATNLITPITDAICDGVPMVVLCGQAATFAPEAAFQSCPAVEMTKPCTKWSYQIMSAAEVPFMMDYAFYIAREGRPGPVFIDLPKDLQNQVITKDLISEWTGQLVDDPNKEKFVSLSSRRRSGETFHSICLGDTEKSLPFEVTGEDENLKLQPIHSAASSDDEFVVDHHQTDMVYRSATGQNGNAVSAAEGDLEGSQAMTEMIELIKGAKKPVIIAGQGCNDAPEELKALAETLQIPVTTTLHAMGVFDERHPLALNMLGMHGHATPNFMVQEADLIINIGSRFDDRITGAIGSFIPEARKAAEEGRGGVIHVDIRKSEKAKQVEPTFFVHSTGKKFLQAVNRQLSTIGDPADITGRKIWLEYKSGLEKQYPVPIPHYKTETVTIDGPAGEPVEVQRTKMSAQYVAAEMNRILTEADRLDDAIYTTGVGIHQMVAAQHITWTQPRQLLSSGSLGTMGVALGYAIGAKLANGKRLVIAIDGDGSFNMTFTELKTVAEHKIPVKIIIFDNEADMMVEYWQRLFHEERYIAVANSNPDYMKLADSFGIKSIYCDHAEDLDGKLQQFLFEDVDEPVIMQVRIERTPCLPMVCPGKALDDMIHEDKDFNVDASAAPS
mmetsp:Transcript_10520/g.30986  ORF Transcript_10520/g.30986 Transcript_10520/m.30986 type:complete len:824 (-) Transcript_10520:195-2666(-)|eukprot:CAMPEP_0113542930 /NCGR_PEP_ID=MMETSP0015_2-20120614/9883_1 /TAXON_ID=2838 /ORGANISM="Odontella" /LENGTH=823 /DNA_ID=CAMNT_0000443047 /DNA_START=474 /DNA_END=2945 /DNA_ORIENTATION=+ /assembly_acc=CAM_ASM_000160